MIIPHHACTAASGVVQLNEATITEHAFEIGNILRDNVCMSTVNGRSVLASIRSDESGIRGHYRSTFGTAPFFFRSVEFPESGKKVLFNIREREVGGVQLIVAPFAKPHQAVLMLGFTDPFDDQAHGSLRADRAVWNLWGEKKHLSCPDGHINRFPVLLNFYDDIAFKLIEEFFRLIVVVVLSGIGAAHDHDDVICAFGIEILVANRWLEQVSVLIYPLLEVKRFVHC